VKYLSPYFAGFRFGALYGFSNQAGGFTNNRAYSFGMSYVSGAWSFGAGYLQLNSSARTPAQLNTNGAVTDTTGSSLQSALTPTVVPLGVLASSQKTFGAGVNYTFGPAVAGFVYSHSKFAQFFQNSLSGTFQNFEGNIRYALTPAVELSGAYTYTRAGGNGGAGGVPHWNQVSAMADYRFSRRTDVYIQGVWQRVSPSGNSPLGVAWINGVTEPSSTSNQIEATVGVRHRF
jgi:predicted porin